MAKWDSSHRALTDDGSTDPSVALMDLRAEERAGLANPPATTSPLRRPDPPAPSCRSARRDSSRVRRRGGGRSAPVARPALGGSLLAKTRHQPFRQAQDPEHVERAYAVRLDGIRMSKNGRGKAEMGKAES